MGDYAGLAAWLIMIGGTLELDKFGLEYRKNKTIADVIKAREKGIKAGNAKIEFELNMIEVYLKDVLKVKKKTVT